MLTNFSGREPRLPCETRLIGHSRTRVGTCALGGQENYLTPAPNNRLCPKPTLTKFKTGGRWARRSPSQNQPLGAMSVKFNGVTAVITTDTATEIAPRPPLGLPPDSSPWPALAVRPQLDLQVLAVQRGHLELWARPADDVYVR